MEKKSLFDKVKDIPVIALCSECDDGQTEIAMSLTTKEVRCVLSGALAGIGPYSMTANRLYIYTTKNKSCVDVEVQLKDESTVIEFMKESIVNAFMSTLYCAEQFESGTGIMDDFVFRVYDSVCSILDVCKDRYLIKELKDLLYDVCLDCFEEGFSNVFNAVDRVKACLATVRQHDTLRIIVDKVYTRFHRIVGCWDDTINMRLDLRDSNFMTLWTLFDCRYSSFEPIIDHVVVTLPMDIYMEEFIRWKSAYHSDDGYYQFAILDVKDIVGVGDTTTIFNRMLEIYTMCDAVAMVWELPCSEYSSHPANLFDAVNEIQKSGKEDTPTLLLYSRANKSIQVMAEREGVELPTEVEGVDTFVEKAVGMGRDILSRIIDNVDSYPYYVCEDDEYYKWPLSLGDCSDKYTMIEVLKKVMFDTIG